MLVPYSLRIDRDGRLMTTLAAGHIVGSALTLPAIRRH
jgi:hypothetical protein